jgi:holo-[acyl-carrier protein] synthase
VYEIPHRYIVPQISLAKIDFCGIISLMVVGIGIDIVEVGRIAKAMKRSQFTRKVLSELEEVYCNTPSRVAGRWAAKEAVIKAVGISLVMKNIEILNDPLGQPHVKIHDPAFDGKRLRIYVSITHEKTHAAAVAVVERAVMQVPMAKIE